MSDKTMLWYKLINYLIPGALGMLMIYSAATSYSNVISGGTEPAGGSSEYSSLSGPSMYDPYSPELKDIFFDKNSYAIRKDAKPVLDENAEVLKSEPNTFVVIESFCDSGEGSPSGLGAKRADSVKEYLIERGVDHDRVITANKCNIYDMQFVNSRDSVRLDSRVHFVALDTIANRQKLASAR